MGKWMVKRLGPFLPQILYSTDDWLIDYVFPIIYVWFTPFNKDNYFGFVLTPTEIKETMQSAAALGIPRGKTSYTELLLIGGELILVD